MMKKPLSLRSRAALLVGAAFLATPALAQETVTQPQTTAPPVVVAPPPPIATTPAPAPAPQIQMAPQSSVVQPAPPPGPAPVAETETEAQPTREAAAERASPETARTTRSVSRSRTTQTSAAPAAVVAPAQPAASAVPQPTEPVLSEAPIAAAPPATSAVTEDVQTNESATLNWSWIAGGALALIAALAAAMLMMRRRRPEEEVADARVVRQPGYDEPVVVTPPRRTLAEAHVRTPATRPLHDYGAAIAPAAAAAAAHRDTRVMEAPAQPLVEAELADADRTDLAAIAEAPAPVANRPWLEFGLRPIRAGTSEEEALVDVELTVGNAGDTPARDVRISTFMLADAEDSEMERLLTGHGSGSAVPPVTIAPGDGTRVDAHLAVPKGEMGRTFNPVVVAEARYTLPDGREGRTSAAFRVGRSAPAAEGVGAIGASRPHIVEDVEAELIGAPERA